VETKPQDGFSCEGGCHPKKQSRAKTKLLILNRRSYLLAGVVPPDSSAPGGLQEAHTSWLMGDECYSHSTYEPHKKPYRSPSQRLEEKCPHHRLGSLENVFAMHFVGFIATHMGPEPDTALIKRKQPVPLRNATTSIASVAALESEFAGR